MSTYRIHECGSECEACRDLAAKLVQARRDLKRSEDRFRNLADRIRADAALEKANPRALDLGWALSVLDPTLGGDNG